MSGSKPSDDAAARPEGDAPDERGEAASKQHEGDDATEERGDEVASQSEGGEVMPSPQDEEVVIKKKYGGIVPRKPPLISKDHERAFFDSADWALGKQGGNPQKPKGPLEALRPKLQPTQQQTRSRRFLYASSDNEEGLNSPTEDANQKEDSNEDKDEK